ncbi:Histone-Lysine N-Methyltransferase ash1l [Mortierella sp. AD031]|nr:Histone-Lysine N-Methyltransferase ash1l [Mortierella sp. AD031]
MAIKSKKRKLAANGRSTTEARSASNAAEAELEREEEEMLAMTRLLKQVDEKEAISVAKKMILEKGGGSAEAHTEMNTEDSGLNGHSEDSETVRQDKPVGQSSHTNGTVPTTNGASSALEQDSPSWVGELTMENVERQNDTHEQERLERSQDQDRDVVSDQPEPTTSVANRSIAGNESVEPSATRSSLRTSLRKAAVQSQDSQNRTETSTNDSASIPARAESSARSAHSADADMSDTASSAGSTKSLAANLPVVFRPDEAEGSTSAIVSGFEMPIKDLTQPRLSQALISRKARTIYAPDTAKALPARQPDQPKRRPGRPPGYFLGPTSCAFCRQQHRRCDYNTVCHRCIKAKIPCDRSGTVERPSIIVREARIQAKAEAAAVLELAVAAGFADQPDPKTMTRLRPKTTTTPCLSTPAQGLDQESLESSSSSSSAPAPSSTVREGVKRRRSPSPTAISRDNIIQQRVKRVAAAKVTKAQETSALPKSKGASASRGRSEASSSRREPSSIPASEDGGPEVIEADNDCQIDDSPSTQPDEATSMPSDPTPSSSTPSDSQPETNIPSIGSSNSSGSTPPTATVAAPSLNKIVIPAAALQRAYRTAAELAQDAAAPHQRKNPLKVRVRASKTADTTGKRKAGRPPGGKFVPTEAHLTPANQAVLIRAQSVSNPQALEPETMRLMMMLKRRPGRPPWKHTLPQPEPAIKRPVGRPTNAERFALNPSLIPPPKAVDPNRRGPGRPVRSSHDPNAPTSSSTQVKSLIIHPPKPPSSKTSQSRATPATSKSVIPAKRTHAAASGSQSQSSTSASAAKGKSVASRAVDVVDDDTESNKSEPLKSNVRVVRKAYLKSGLYSSDLKVNPVENANGTKSGPKSVIASRAIVSSRQRAKAESAAAAANSFFELPINYGAVLMSKQKDFFLPFDIMQAWQLGLLRKTVQPEPFIKIRSNIFVERKRRTETSPMVCHCKPPRPEQGRIGCGDDCYNRVMFYECISAHCPCGDLCSNQRFQKKHNEDHLRVIWTQERGFGIQTTAPIKKGNLVIEYRGEVISQSECHRRMEGIYKNNKNFYFLEYERGEVVDACQKGTNARFVNHSCSPNSQIEKWFLNGEMSIGIFASQDIPAGAEISYDYNFSSFSGAQKQRCRCGAANCRGYIGERISKNKEAAKTLTKETSGRSGHKADAKKRKTGRRGLTEQETASMRLGQMPSVGSIRQRQSDKYKEDKMAAIRYTRLFLFRNIRLVGSKYVKYAQTKSRSFQERVSPTWLAQARQCRKRSLEGVVEDLRQSALEQEEAENQERFVDDDDDDHAEGSIAGDDASDFLQSASIIEVQDTDAENEGEQDDEADAMDHYDGSSVHESQVDYDEADQHVEGEYEYEYEYEEEDGSEEYYQSTTVNVVHPEDMQAEDEEEYAEDADYAELAGEAVEEEEYEVVEVEMKSTVTLTGGGISTTNRSDSAESLGSTVAAGSSPVSVQGSIDTLVEDMEAKSKKEAGSRRLRARN